MSQATLKPQVYDQSNAFFEKARRIFPGGVNSPVRSFRSVGGKPFAVRRGDGPYIWDLDGNRYIDLVNSWGALIHGHNHPEIRKAVEEAAQGGLSYGVTCPQELALGETLLRLHGDCDMLRFVTSGTEACMSAIRVARGATGRDLVVKFDGHYHGHGDSFLVAAGSGLATLALSDSAGVSEATAKQTMVLPFNDRAALKKAFETEGLRIAAVILEVVTGNMGVVLPDAFFLNDLRALTEQSGALLIFDEVMTGFRLSQRGAAGLYGVGADLYCFGKIVGGGMPVGAYGGKRAWMEKVAPLGPVYQAGTLAGNPLSCAAGLASLTIIEREGALFYQRLDAAAAHWKSAIEAHARVKGYAISVAQAGSMLSIFFREKVPTHFQEVKSSDAEKFKAFFWALLKRGVYFPPSAFESTFLSSAHSEEVMDVIHHATFDALDEVFEGS